LTNNAEDIIVSDFNELEDIGARNYNRGQVLANIFESYVHEGCIPARNFKGFLYEAASYLARIPIEEHDLVKSSLRRTLTARGYVHEV
jgi:hypothetical protein